MVWGTEMTWMPDLTAAKTLKENGISRGSTIQNGLTLYAVFLNKKLNKQLLWSLECSLSPMTSKISRNKRTDDDRICPGSSLLASLDQMMLPNQLQSSSGSYLRRCLNTWRNGWTRSASRLMLITRNWKWSNEKCLCRFKRWFSRRLFKRLNNCKKSLPSKRKIAKKKGSWLKQN